MLPPEIASVVAPPCPPPPKLPLLSKSRGSDPFYLLEERMGRAFGKENEKIQTKRAWTKR
ncbi:hypothetical protein COLO4_38148 [Corchorus olitorius]|uniref:Uncharacterized protein n=1 Tax=Corchorus olitorius TaxID=93759 RepID=A0A1R3FWN6_9ROSI|nr:hypothetical protein COLO4_38148 [Corchorus olitorius]